MVGRPAVDLTHKKSFALDHNVKKVIVHNTALQPARYIVTKMGKCLQEMLRTYLGAQFVLVCAQSMMVQNVRQNVHRRALKLLFQ